MPDTVNPSNYNRADDFLNQGYANLNPSAPAPQFPPAEEGAKENIVPSAKDIFDSISANLKTTTFQENPFLGSTKFTTPYRTPLAQTIRYDSPKYGFNPFNPELEHQYAARQGFIDSWKNNVLKFGAEVGGTFLETVTSIPQVLNGIKDGDFSKIYNNPLSNSISDWKDGLENTLPNYQSAFEDQHPFLSYIPGFASLKTLGDKWGGILKTLGFVVGTAGGALVQDAIVGAATEGIGELPLLDPQLQSLTGKIGKIFASPKGASTVAEAMTNGARAEDAINSVYGTIRNTDRFRYNLSLFTSAAGSSMIFANGVYNDTKRQLNADYYQKYGRDPVDGDAQRIEESAAGAGNADLFANTALQMKVFDNVFSTVFKPAATAIKDAENQVARNANIVQTGTDVFEKINPQGKFAILKKIGEPSRIGSTLLNTTGEMAGIYGIQRTAEDFYKRKYDDSSISDTDNFMRSLATGLNDTFTTQQGIENVLIGVLGGALIHGAKLGVEAYKGVDTNTDSITKGTLDLLNSSRVSDLFRHTYDEAVTADSLTKSIKKAADEGNTFEYENLKHQQLFNFVSSGIKSGRWDLRLQQIEAMKDLKSSEFEKLFGLDFNDTNKKTVNEYVDDVIAKAKDIKQQVDKVNTVFKNPFRPSDRKNHIAFEEYKNQLSLDLSDLDNNRNRLSSLSQEIQKGIPLADKDKIIDLTHELGIERTIGRFQERIKAINESAKVTEEKSPFYKEDQAEKAFLENRITELQSPKPEEALPEILNYYANGDKLSGDHAIHPIDQTLLLNKAQDAFKLQNLNNRALYHYQQLTSKKGFDNYIGGILAENNVNYQRYIDALKSSVTNPENQAVKPADADVVDIDENGNIATQAPKTETKTPAPIIETPEEKKAAESARKDYSLTRAKIESKALTAKQLAGEEQAPVVLSTTKAEQQVDISEIENPENQDATKIAQDTKSEKHGALKSSIFKNFDPFVYVNRVYSKNFKDGAQENDNLRKALFSMTPQELHGKIELNVSRATKGKAATEYSRIQREGVGVYRSGFSHDIDLVVNGDVIGKMQPADTLFYKEDDQYKPLISIPKNEYERVTGNDLSTYDEFINQLRLYQEITDNILRQYQETGKKIFSNAEVQNLLNTFVRYGFVDYSKAPNRSIPLSDVKYGTNGDFVISIPNEYNTETGKTERSKTPEILNEHELSTTGDRQAAWQFIADNIDQLRNIDSRYVYVTKLPNGKYEKISPLAARPTTANPQVIGGLLNRLAQITDTTSNADIRKLNNDFRNEIFISDANNRKGGGSTLQLAISENGKAYINIYNKRTGFRKGLYLPNAKDAKNLEELVAQINNQLYRKSSEDPVLQKLNLSLDIKDFKTSIPNVERIDLKDLKSKLTVAAPHGDIFDNFSLHVLPLKSKATEGLVPFDKKTLEPQEQDLVQTLQASIDQLAEPIKKNVQTLVNAGEANQKQLAETITAVVENDPEAAKEMLGEKVVEKAQEAAKVKPAKKKVIAKKKTKVEQTQEVVAQVAEAEHNAPKVQEQGVKAPEVQSKEPVVAEAKTHVKDIPEMYQQHFLDKTEDTLKNIAEQLRDPNSEKLTRKTFGDKVSDLALKAFPETKAPEEDLLAKVKAEEVPLDQVIEEQIAAMREITPADLHTKPKTEAEINEKYNEQFNKMNATMEQLIEHRETLLDKKAPTEDDKAKIAEYDRRIEEHRAEIEAYQAERFKELEALKPKEINEGDKVMYEGKEVVVTEKAESGNGEPVYVVSDGGKGESVVYKDKIYQIDPTIGEPADLPNAIERGIEAGDKVWYSGKLYQVMGENADGKLILENPQTDEITAAVKEATIPHNETAENNYLVEYSGLKSILDTLRKRFNIQYQVVNDAEGDWKGRFKDGIVYVNKANVDRTTPFHEYLHPFMKVLEVDNPELSKSLNEEFRNLLIDKDPIAIESAKEVFDNKAYQDDSDADKQSEALVRYISKLSAKNITPEGKKVSASYMRAMDSLISRFRKWLGEIWKYFTGVPIKKIPTDMNLQDVADMVSMTDYAFDLKSRMDLVDTMDVFQKKADNFDKEIFDRLNQKLDKFIKTGARLKSEELSTEAATVRKIFENKDEAESLNSFVFQGLKGLSWATDEFNRITGKLKNEDVKLTQADIREMNKSLSVVKQMLAFYKDDVNDLFKRVGDRKSMDDDTYRDYAETLRKANVAGDKIQTRSVDLMVEWLYPAIEHTNELIREKYPHYVLSKDDFRKQMYNATGDVDRLFFALGSVGSSKDPVSGIVSNVIKETVEDAHRYDAVLSHVIKTGYDEFLAKEGLKNERGVTGDFYKKNYLRKARILEKTGEDEQGNDTYDYKERWAFHQPYFFDKWVEEYEGFIKDLKEEPQSQAWKDKLFEWQANNGTIITPAKRFLNPQFHDLYDKDKMFTILYDTYTEGNGNLHAEEQLQYGIVPQVSTGKNMFSDLSWSKSGAINIAKRVGKFFVPKAEEGNEYDVSLTNMDGSVYKTVKVAHIRPLEEADLDLALPETVFKFAGVANLAKEMRDLEPNVRTLKSLLDGDSQFIKQARGVTDVIKKSKLGGKAENIVNTVFSSKKNQRQALVNKQLSAFIDDVVYGQPEQKDTFAGIDLNKWGNNMAFLTALNNMAFNITAGISNVVIGDIQAFGEALGGKYFKPENYRKAQGQYWGGLLDFARDVSELKKSKITQLGIKYDAIQGEFRDKYGKRFVGNVMQKYASPDTLFIFNHAGEHHIQLTGMLAFMDATKVKTTDGNEMSLFDAHEITPNGYLKLKDNVIWTTQDDNDFTKRLHSLNKMLNGNYSKFDKSYLQRKWYGKLALIYRKYLYNAFRQRYGTKRLDYELQDVYEGYYRTFFNKLGKDIKAYKFEAATRFLNRKGWTADEKYAYNKTMYEMALFTGITMMGIAMGASESDKDKSGKSWGQNYLTLLMLRARNDVGQYTLFGMQDMVRMMQNPSAVLQALSRYGNFFTQLTTQPFATYKRKTGPFAKGDSVLKAKMLKAIPMVRQVVNFMSPVEQQKFFNLVNNKF